METRHWSVKFPNFHEIQTDEMPVALNYPARVGRGSRRAVFQNPFFFYRNDFVRA
jgi:hypothetical protein